MTDLLWDGPEGAPLLVLAHGAGAAMDSAWMNDACTLLGERGVRTARFEFAYMAGRRVGIRKPPPRGDSLVGEYRDAVVAVIEASGRAPVIGGKSMGGRVASMVADGLYAEGDIRGLVCLGYPFHPMGKPEQLRTAHLAELATPTLICQGERDTLGMRDEVAEYTLSPAIRIEWLPDGDHDLRPRKAVSGFTYRQNLEAMADAVSAFVLGSPPLPRVE